MAVSGRPRLPLEVEYAFWSLVRQGESLEAAAAGAGVSARKAALWMRHRGGVMPPPSAGRRSRCLSFTEREDIAAWRAAGLGVRAIARVVGRSPSTISRELRRVSASRAGRADRGYRASTAQADADAKSRRPKQAKLATNERLRTEVNNRLGWGHSPEQIAGRLKADFPSDPEMWVSHETIYQALYVQSRGALKRELARHLRTGRAVRKPGRRPDQRRGQIPNMVNIAQRPKQPQDHAVPGDWEGDLILGSTATNSAIGTLVERTSGFTLLVHLDGDHTANTVAEAMITTISDLPEQLRRTLTWDQGKEMSSHARITAATGIQIYFCDPHAPWQRGLNENTNGLLRQYFPKGSDLSRWGPGYLELVAQELNNRPRKRHGWATPAEKLNELLSNPTNPPDVATTA